MAISLSGQLSIKYRNGRNGRFPVGELSTEIGTFGVKSKEFEQYSEGTYQGKFLIGQIEIAQYSSGSAIHVSLQARLIEFSIENFKTGRVKVTEPVVPDPADEECDSGIKSAPQNQPPQQKVTLNTPEPNSDSDHKNADLELFGSEIYEQITQIASEVALDASVGRVVLRLQADRMKQLGYRFNPSRQVWNK